jgi:hypothetical protein
MPLFAQLFAAFFGALGTFLARIFAAKIALRVLAVGAISALGGGLVVLFNTFAAPLASAIFATSYGQLLGLIFPPVAGTCCATLLAFWVACLTYRLKVRAIEITAGI